ncbi:hypothetical protein MJ904_15550 [Massilia sp. MB5]|uniref:hypothetical protein n=1 Tax=Massilia sp. MB5 TaxID=2919578 RepID=UPI001F0E072B|nr:hypothetical protein [Massilia sp. MB5]UMR28560.1 hypothetical protein MJ904_15550 [Massilia sp. MB5]
MIDQRTANLRLPLPHPDNELKDDVLRLRDSLSQLDGIVQSLQGLVASDDVNLDTVQEIVTVLKQAQGNIGSITSLLATKANKSDMASDLNVIQAALALTKTDLASETAERVLLAGRVSASEKNINTIQSTSVDRRKFLQSYAITLENF